MVGSIQLFQFVQKFHQTIGINLFQPNQNECSTTISARTTTIFACMIQFTLSVFAYLVFEAKSLFDYGIGFFAIICSIAGILICALFVSQQQNFSKFIKICEEFIEKSKHNSLCCCFCKNFYCKQFNISFNRSTFKQWIQEID